MIFAQSEKKPGRSRTYLLSVEASSWFFGVSVFISEPKILSVLTNKKKVENWISHCIFKSCAEGFRGYFMLER